MRSTMHALNGNTVGFATVKNRDDLSIQPSSVRRRSRADVLKKFDDRRHGAKGDSEMSGQRSTMRSITISESMPTALRPAMLRAGLVLAVLAAMAAFTVRVETEQTRTSVTLSANTSALR